MLIGAAIAILAIALVLLVTNAIVQTILGTR